MLLTSYLARDIFILRLLTLIAGCTMIPFHFFVQGGPMTLSIFWSIVFIIVNIYQIIHLYNDRKPIILSRQEQAIYQNEFKNFTVKQFSKLMKFAQKKKVDAGESILIKDNAPEQVSLLVNGKAVIEDKKDGDLAIGSGQLIGAVNFITRTAVKKNY